MKLAAFFNLIRWKNLLLIVYLFFLLDFFFYSFQLETKLATFQFIVLLASVLLITAAGYIINDIYDVNTDLINKPHKVIVSKIITLEQAKHWYKIINSIGISLGIALCLSLNKPSYSFIFIGTSLLLYYYSKKLKATPLLGNFIVSFLVTMSVFILPLFDINFSVQYYHQNLEIKILIILSLFAFCLNLIREIIKDIEDVNGDYALNMNTLPILIGTNRTKIVTLGLITIPIGLILNIIFNFYETYKLPILYLILFILIPLVYLIAKIRVAKKKNDFHKLSLLLKIVMFMGMNSIIIFSIFH